MRFGMRMIGDKLISVDLLNKQGESIIIQKSRSVGMTGLTLPPSTYEEFARMYPQPQWGSMRLIELPKVNKVRRRST